jgi:hypothetical protein
MAATDFDLLGLAKQLAPITPGARWVETENEDGSSSPSAWVPYGPGFEIPLVFTYADDGTSLFHWTLVAAVIDGRPRCLRLMFEVGGVEPELPRPITPEGVHSFPLGRLLEEATLMASRPTNEVPRRFRGWESPEQVRRERSAVAMQHRKRPNGHRRRRLTEEHLAEVADVYRQHVPTGKPSKAVAEFFHYSPSSARRVIREARLRGILGKAWPGRAGEQLEEETNG